MSEFTLQTSTDLLAQLNNLPSPSSLDPHSSMTSENAPPNSFDSEKSNLESTLPSDDKIKSIMSMYPGSDSNKGVSSRPATQSATYPTLDSWPTYQVSPKLETKSPIQTRVDTPDTQSETNQTHSYVAPQHSYSPRTEPRAEQTASTNHFQYRLNQQYQTQPSYSPPVSTTSPTTPLYQPPTTQNTASYPSLQNTQTYNTVTSPSTPLYQAPSVTTSQTPYSSTSGTSAQNPYTTSALTSVQQTSYNVQGTNAQSTQAVMTQIEKLQQQNAQQQQALQQHFSQQLQMQKQLLAFQQTESVTKEFIEKMQSSFTKIMGFMESVDQRLSNLEKVTQSILHNQNTAPTATTTATPAPPPATASSMPHPPAFPSYAMPLPSYSSSSNSVYPTLQTADEVDALRKIEQFEEDQKLAKRLQEELELEAKKSSSKTPIPSSSTKKPTPATTTKKDDETAICPICNTQISFSEIESHADKCLESSSTTKKDSNGQPTPSEKAGFFAKLFGKDSPTPTPTPTPTPVPTKPTTTPVATSATTKPTTTTATPATVAHMPTNMPTAFQPGPGNPNGQFYQVPFPMYNTGYPPYGYSQYPPPGTSGQQGYYYYPGQQPPTQQPKKN